MDIGRKIKFARGKRSQLELAEKLSISANTLSAYENNRVIPTYEILKEICKKLDVKADEILEIKDIYNTPTNQSLMFHQKLINIREKLNLTQAQMAELIEVTEGTLSKYERGNIVPPVKRIKLICEKCKVSADYLFDL